MGTQLMAKGGGNSYIFSQRRQQCTVLVEYFCPEHSNHFFTPHKKRMHAQLVTINNNSSISHSFNSVREYMEVEALDMFLGFPTKV